MPTLEKQLKNAEIKRDIAAAKLEALRVMQTYRAVDDTHNRRKRNAPSIEFKGEDEQLTGLGRLKSIAKARDVRRNYGAAKAQENQTWLNVIGTCPKVIVHLDDEQQGEEWSNWFNQWFAKHCDGRGELHLGDQARLTLMSVKRDGDILCYFDSAGVIPRGQGKLWYWEADQLPEITEKDLAKNESAIRRRLSVPDDVDRIHVSHGIITDDYGRAVGYLVTKNHAQYGKHLAKFDECTVLSFDDCRLLFNPWRINQKRGISDTIEIANLWQDLERFTEAMIQRSIIQSFLALEIRKKDGVIQGRDAVYDSENSNGVPDVTSSDISSGENYKNFEKLSMNAIQYMDPDEEVVSHQLAGDLPDAQQLIDYMLNTGGWSQGLSRMYATGRADASYSASMAENNLTWAMFEWWQKWDERYYFDWVADKAFSWATSTNRLSNAQTALWKDKYSWHNWPVKRAINPMQEASARRIDLETGATNYEKIHGPYWKKILAGLGEQIKHARDNGFFSPLFKPQSTNNTTNQPRQSALGRLFGRGE